MTGSSANTPALVDTNVVVYAHDSTDPRKHTMARDLLTRLSGAGFLYLSVQVLNEFASVMLRPHRPPILAVDEVETIVKDLAATGTILPLTLSMTYMALDAVDRHGLSFWDALIWASARENGVPMLYTEDFQHGRDVEGVRIINPFFP